MTPVSSYGLLRPFGVTPVQLQVSWTQEKKMVFKLSTTTEVSNIIKPVQNKIDELNKWHVCRPMRH